MSQANVSHLPSTNATNKILAEREVDEDLGVVQVNPTQGSTSITWIGTTQGRGGFSGLKRRTRLCISCEELKSWRKFGIPLI